MSPPAPPASSRIILVVCFGNLCRSPMAEGLFRDALPDAEWRIVSAGTHAIGDDPPTGGAIEAARRVSGIDISAQRSRLLTTDLIEDSDHVFTMSRLQALEAAALVPAAAARIRLLGAFAPGGTRGITEPGGGRAGDDEIADPMGGDAAEYEACCRRLGTSIEAAVRWLDDGADPAAAPPPVAVWNGRR